MSNELRTDVTDLIDLVLDVIEFAEEEDSGNNAHEDRSREKRFALNWYHRDGYY